MQQQQQQQQQPAAQAPILSWPAAQQSPPPQQPQQPQSGDGATPGAPPGNMSPEQYHMMLLQYQLQQTQAHAQAQAQLLAMYQQQQQQQQLHSAAAAYHQALMQAARTQSASAYGAPPQQAPNPYGAPNPYAAYGAYGAGYGAYPGMQPPGIESTVAQPGAPNAQQPPAQSPLPPMPPQGAPAAAPTPAAQKPGESAPTDARIHASLASTPVEWVPLPPRYVMDSVAKTALAAKTVEQKARTDADGASPDPSSKTATKTVFVGGISYDVARDPRVIPWLAASMCKKPVVVRKVIPHKERRGKQDAAGQPPKLALSAFAVVDGDDVDRLVECLHHSVLWDIGGCWIARTPEAIDALRDYANAQCTWQKREAGAQAGLPRHMMTVEHATAAGSAAHAANGDQKTTRGSHVSPTPNFGHGGVPTTSSSSSSVVVGTNSADRASGGAPPAGKGPSLPLLPSVFMAPARGVHGDDSASSDDSGRRNGPPLSQESPAPDRAGVFGVMNAPKQAPPAVPVEAGFRLDWGALGGAYGGFAASAQPQTNRSSGRNSRASSSGNIGDRS